MIDFPIEVNGVSIMSSEIFPFVRNYQTKKAIEYLIQKTRCNNEEAMDIVNDLREFTISHRNNNKTDFNNAKTKNIKNITKENIPKCPMCGSTNIQKISDLSRTSSILGFGILSKKIGKQWQCNNPKCKHLW